MMCSFLAGYTIRSFVTDTFVTIPSSSLLAALESKKTTAETETNSSASSIADSSSFHFPAINPAISMDDDSMRGNKDASITMIEFSDYQCPFCKRTFYDTMPNLKEKYIDREKVKHVFRNYPISFHQNFLSAAIAAKGANEQEIS